MKEREHCRKYCSYKLHDLEKVELFLEEKAKEGWIVQKHFGGWFTFKKEKPQNIRYYVEVYEKEKLNNSYQNIVNQTFIKSCEKKGWKFVDADSRFQILRSDNPKAKRPSILASDKIKSIYKSCFLEYRYLFVCLLLMSLFNMIFAFTGVVKILSSLSQLLYVSAWAVFSIYLIAYVASQRKWYQRALSLGAKEKKLPENPRHRYLYIALICAIVLLLLSIIGFFIESHTYSSGRPFTRCVILLGIISLGLIVILVRDHKIAWKNGIGVGFIVILIDIVIFGTASQYSSIFEQIHKTREYESKIIYDDPLPITLDGLGVTKGEGIAYTTYHEVFGEFLIKQDYYSEEPAERSKGREPSLCYQVYRTDQSVLYKRILSEECFAKNSRDGYEELPSEKSVAKAILKKQLDTGFYEYIFEFDRQIIKMNINVELSEEQLQKIHTL